MTVLHPQSGLLPPHLRNPPGKAPATPVHRLDAPLPSLTGERLSGDAGASSRGATDHLRWLVSLRWLALCAVLLAVFVAPLFGVRGLNRPLLLGVVGLGVAYNVAFRFALGRFRSRVDNVLVQALLDFGALTLALWASGGVRNPFVALYLVHVLLVSTVSGRRAALLACGAALLSSSFLVLVELVPSLRVSAFVVDPQRQPVLSAIAFMVILAASGYVLDRAWTELSAHRKEAEDARRALRRDEEILLAAMDRLEVGVEVLAPDNTPRFRNRHLLLRRGDSTDCPRDSHTCEPFAGCPVDAAREGRPGGCRFSQRDRAGRERVIEVLSYPLSDEVPSPVLRLHLDRTESVIAERRLLFAERLASLGRTAQVVAHELNTPLSTIQTLASDMRAALSDAPKEAAALVADLGESAQIIHDETGRCRRITQDLLAGRDLLAGSSTSAACDVHGALRRAAIIVFGSGGSAARLEMPKDLPKRTVAMGHDSLVQVFVNLLQNASDAIEESGNGKVHVRLEEPEGGRVAVVVDDDGPGLAAGTGGRLFEPFYTTKPPGKGTGLGLYTSATLVGEAGGTVTLEGRAEGGARARVVLPLAGAT